MGKRWIEQRLGAAAGEAVTVSPDLVLVTNGPSHGVTEFVSGVEDPERALVMYDHNVPSGSPEDARVFGEILGFSKAYKIRFAQAKGIALQYLFDEKIRPGQIIVTGSRHSSLFGAKGALGIGICNTELARVLETGHYNVVVPDTVGVALTGTLPEGTGMIDGALCFLRQHQEDLRGKAVEFIGGGLDVHERAVLCHMACDTGAYTAVWTEEGEHDVVFDLSGTVPMLRMPCADAQAQTDAPFCPASSLEGTIIQAGQIGGCNGGTFEELRRAARIIRDKKLKRGFRLSISPATSADYIKALDEGLIETFIDYGAQINAAGDHSVVPQGAGAMGPKEKLLTTGLYTYAGCMGCEDAEVMTASVETIMRASIEVR